MPEALIKSCLPLSGLWKGRGYQHCQGICEAGVLHQPSPGWSLFYQDLMEILGLQIHSESQIYCVYWQGSSQGPPWEVCLSMEKISYGSGIWGFIWKPAGQCGNLEETLWLLAALKVEHCVQFCCHCQFVPRGIWPLQELLAWVGCPLLTLVFPDALVPQPWPLWCFLQDMLCVPERRLLEDSRNLPISASTNRSDRILLFDDVLVLIQVNFPAFRGDWKGSRDKWH